MSPTILQLQLSIYKHPNTKTNMSPFKCINLLLFAIICLSVNNTYADPFESDYNII